MTVVVLFVLVVFLLPALVTVGAHLLFRSRKALWAIGVVSFAAVIPALGAALVLLPHRVSRTDPDVLTNQDVIREQCAEPASAMIREPPLAEVFQIDVGRDEMDDLTQRGFPRPVLVDNRWIELVVYHVRRGFLLSYDREPQRDARAPRRAVFARLRPTNELVRWWSRRERTPLPIPRFEAERVQELEVRGAEIFRDAVIIQTSGRTLELRDLDLSLRARATDVSEERCHGWLSDGSSGAFVVGLDRNARYALWHLSADGRTRRGRLRQKEHTDFQGPFLSRARNGGFCEWGAEFDRVGHLDGDPPRPTPWPRAVIVRGWRGPIIALALALIATLLSIAVAVPRLRRSFRLLRRRRLLIGKIRRAEGALRWLDADGTERAVASVDEWLAFDHADAPSEEDAVAFAPSIDPIAKDGAYRQAPAPIRVRMLVRGTLPEARKWTFARLLDMVAYCGLALLVTAIPGLCYVFASLLNA